MNKMENVIKILKQIQEVGGICEYGKSSKRKILKELLEYFPSDWIKSDGDCDDEYIMVENDEYDFFTIFATRDDYDDENVINNARNIQLEMDFADMAKVVLP